MTETISRLARKLTLFDTIMIGLGSMMGAGIFVALAPATSSAGAAVWVAVLLAALLAYLNASSTAQLAVLYPESGGVYTYGSKQLGDYWGFLAGCSFVIGKIASCAAVALTFAHYVWPAHATFLAISAVIIFTVINYWGIKKTALATQIIVIPVIVILLMAVVSSLFGGAATPQRFQESFSNFSIFGILEATGFMFFAFAGYARIATLGEEVINPQKNIPKAIVSSLAITVFLYILVTFSLLLCMNTSEIASSQAPLVEAVRSGKYSFVAPLVIAGAALASLGVLLSLLAGVSRTVYAMALNKHLPHKLSLLHSQKHNPYRAEFSVSLAIILILSVSDIRSAIGFSSFAVLVYYAIAHLSAWTLTSTQRLWPRGYSALGFISCSIIALSLPFSAIRGGLILMGLGTIYYFLNKKYKPRTPMA
jgi:basic amino acid/polyamine antiporter, APA family